MEVAVPEGARKRSWSELKQLLKEIRLNAAIVPRSVSDVKFRAVPGGRIRIYFISSPLPGKGNTIMSADISVLSDCEATAVRGGNIQWAPLLDPTFQSSLGGSKCSKQEMSMFDRKRIMSWGISSYELHPTGRILFPSGDRLFHCPSGDDRVGLYPLEVPLAGQAASNAEMCPANPDLIAYVFEGDIWVQHLMGDDAELPKRMTFCASIDKRDRMAGYPSFVMQEEFDRYQGFWWQPICEDGTYRILFEEVDETNVETYTFGCAMNPEDSMESYKFPRAGTANSKSALKMIEFRLDSGTEGGDGRVRICDHQILTLERSLNEDFPACEYVVRVGWTHEGDQVWAKLLDRPQRRMQTVVIPVAAFSRPDDSDELIEDPVLVPAEVDSEDNGGAGVRLCQVSSSSSSMPSPHVHPEVPGVLYSGQTAASLSHCRKAGIVEVLLQTAPHWLNVDDVMFWFPREKPSSDYRFIYASEETGYRHLYVASVRCSQSHETDGVSGTNNDCHEDDRDDDMQGPEENNIVPSPSMSARCRKRKVLDYRTPPPRRSCSCRSTSNGGDDGQDEDALDEEGMGWRGGSRGMTMALTCGSWEVCEGDVWVDLINGIVYFTAYRDTPLEKHLYAVALDEPGQIRRLTTLGYTHMVSVWVPSPSTYPSAPVIVVDVFSNTSTPPLSQVCRVGKSSIASSAALAPATRGTFGVSTSSPAAALLRAAGLRETVAGLGAGKVDQLVLQRIGYLQGPDAVNQFTDPTYEPPEIFSHRIRSGEILYGMLFKPPNMVLGKKYPTLLTVYAGPKAQLVTNSFKCSKQSRNHVLAAMGYCVVCIDGRGSEHRGHEFETHLYRRLGTVEMKDQVEVLTWLASVKGFIDMNRLAVHGWSYGGYSSLSALIRYPEVFRIAIAAAPVTCWHLYDTAYTERYMDFPGVNSAGYKEGSILSNAHKLPDEENRLLLIHGLMDDNVHFSHTTQLIDALIKAGKPYKLLVYPGERHSLRHYRSNEHYEVSVLSFLEQHL